MSGIIGDIFICVVKREEKTFFQKVLMKMRDLAVQWMDYGMLEINKGKLVMPTRGY